MNPALQLVEILKGFGRCNKFDRGLYLPQLTGFEEIDSIFVDGQDVNLRRY